MGAGSVAMWTLLIAMSVSVLALIIVSLMGGMPTQKIPRTRIVDITKGKVRVIAPRRDFKTKSWRHATHKKGQIKVIEAGRGKPVEHLFEDEELVEFSDPDTSFAIVIHGKSVIAEKFAEEQRILITALDKARTLLAKEKAYNSELEKNLDAKVLKRIKDAGAVLDNVPYIKSGSSKK